MQEVKKTRGQSSSSKAAERHLEKYPGTPAKELAKKFKIDLSTIYRSAWWKKNNQQGESK